MSYSHQHNSYQLNHIHMTKLDCTLAMAKSAAFSILAGRQDPAINYFWRVTSHISPQEMFLFGLMTKTAYPYFWNSRSKPKGKGKPKMLTEGNIKKYPPFQFWRECKIPLLVIYTGRPTCLLRDNKSESSCSKFIWDTILRYHYCGNSLKGLVQPKIICHITLSWPC